VPASRRQTFYFWLPFGTTTYTPDAHNAHMSITTVRVCTWVNNYCSHCVLIKRVLTFCRTRMRRTCTWMRARTTSSERMYTQQVRITRYGRRKPIRMPYDHNLRVDPTHAFEIRCKSCLLYPFKMKISRLGATVTFWTGVIKSSSSVRTTTDVPIAPMHEYIKCCRLVGKNKKN
jgi:hypothetical protein